jgi:SHAQKYF class myb-like DNA-binding protein
MDFYQLAAAPPAMARRPWSKEEDKAFESALVLCPDHAPDRWALVAARLPGRTPQEAWEHYQALVADVDLIERGAVDVPGCWDDDDEASDTGRAAPVDRRAGKARGEERRRGIPWSEEEHKLFLDGLEKYGRGDWRNISRFAVRTRTPTQVASHAQKYFIRQANAATRDSKRKSIHDITTP